MTDKTGSSQAVYISKDVATMLKIQESTLRKYCIMLEEHGYHFHKNEHGHRGFLDNDVITLRKLIEIKSHPDMTLKQACNAILLRFKGESISGIDTVVMAIVFLGYSRVEQIINKYDKVSVNTDLPNGKVEVTL
ncbi:hypothetical protein [Bacillus cereus]|uniref:hypothetical protein n=1 Tax=Bacillus cereus TaxID=1396 RepID=UPI00211B6785|nr:hypothetical protein [Bacillus cereus]